MDLYFASGPYLTFVDNLRIVRDETGIDPFPVKILISYLDVRKKSLEKLMERWFKSDEVQLFLDSGAFGAFSHKILLNVKDYGEWLLQNKDWIYVYPNLDVKHSLQQTADNQKALEDMGLTPLPVYHANEPFEVWEEMTSNYPYVCLGGVAGTKRSKSNSGLGYMTRCLSVSNSNGCHVHGFGIGTPNLLTRVPYYSADSTSFIQSKYGRVIVWDERSMRAQKLKLRSPELIKYEHLFSRYNLPTSPLFMRRPDKYGYTVIRAFEYLQFQRMGEWISAVWNARQKHKIGPVI